MITRYIKIGTTRLCEPWFTGKMCEPGEHFFKEKIYAEVESIKKDIDLHFTYKPECVYRKGIQSLPKRQENDYFHD